MLNDRNEVLKIKRHRSSFIIYKKGNVFQKYFRNHREYTFGEDQ